jgi:hypothetical protein
MVSIRQARVRIALSLRRVAEQFSQSIPERRDRENGMRADCELSSRLLKDDVAAALPRHPLFKPLELWRVNLPLPHPERRFIPY